MSDDLISRKALIEKLEKWCGEQRYLIAEEVWTIIKNAPLAFDKEKVIEKLKDQYNYSRKVRNENDNYYFEYWDGRTDSYKDAIEIVKKGGIE